MSATDQSAVRIEVVACHSDARGFVFEPMPGDDLPQYRNVHIVVSLPGAVRGNHSHVRGTEITTVCGPTKVRFREAIGLYNLEWVSRGHEHLCQQWVGIERYRRDQLIKLAGIEQLRLRLHRGLLILRVSGNARESGKCQW